MKFDKMLYREAIELLRKAAEEVDQADAILRDLNKREEGTVKRFGGYFDASDVTTILSMQAKALDGATCDDCGVLWYDHAEQCVPEETASSEVTQK